jgi:hypothetical protein
MEASRTALPSWLWSDGPIARSRTRFGVAPPRIRPLIKTDPVLELHDGNGATMATNDNWKSASNAAEIQATGLAPSDDRESAILMPFSAGNYTTILRGVNNTTGIAVAEAYKLNN